MSLLFLSLVVAPPVGAATVTLHWTNPVYQANNVCGDDLDNPVHLTAANIYRQLADQPILFMRSHDYSAVAPVTDSIMVSDDLATWSVRGVNTAGESTCITNGYTVGVPTISVPPWWPKEREAAYDVQGRRIEPGASGVYFTRHKKHVRLK